MYLLFLGPGFLRTVLIVVACYYIGKFLLRWWLKSKVKQFTDQAKNSVDEQQAERMRSDKGKVHVQSSARHQEKQKSDPGEYVDYEEVN